MSSTTTIFNESKAEIPIKLSKKEKFIERFKSNTAKQTNPLNNENCSPLSVKIRPLRADDIKEYRLLAIVLCIFCFFLIGPFIAFYYSCRIRTLKKNQELNRAELLSNHLGTMLLILTFIGLMIWICILVLIGILFVFGLFL